MYLLINPCGGAWWAAPCADVSAMISPQKSVFARLAEANVFSILYLLHSRLPLEPFIEVRRLKHGEIRLHVVMSKSAQLSTHNFEPSRLGRREVERNVQPGDEVLLHAQLPHIEGVANIFGVQCEQNWLVHRDGELGGDDVVFGIWITVRIKTKEVLISLINELGMKGSEFAIRPGITKIVGELPGLHIDVHSAWIGRLEIDSTPSLGTDGGESQDFGADNRKGENDEGLSATRYLLRLVSGTTIEKSKCCQHYLSGNK